MEKDVKAVYFKYRYYIFPEEFSDLSKISDGDIIRAKRLKEERCMAPDFIYESIGEESVEIDDKNLLFPVSVNLYSGKEYDEILAVQVAKVCPGCVNFIDNDDESLDGHHREITLNGVCYERETDGDPVSFAVRSYMFLNKVAKRGKVIKACIDGGKMKKLDKLLKAIGFIPPPYNFYGDKKDGKYRLFWRSFGSDDLDENVRYFAALASLCESSPLKDGDIEILPFIPQGTGLKIEKFDENEPRFYVSETTLPWMTDVHIYFKKKASDKALNAYITRVHLKLCALKGEKVVIQTVAGYRMHVARPDSPPPGKLLSFTELSAFLDELFERYAPDGENYYPCALPVKWEKQENALYGKRNFEGVTCCYSVSEIGADFNLKDNFNFNGCIAYAYIFVPTTIENQDVIREAVSYYIVNKDDIPEPVILKEQYLGCTVSIGAGICTPDGSDDGTHGLHENEKEGIVFDFLVTDEPTFYRFITILAPVLSAYGARLVVVNDSGVNEFDCGYTITPVGGKIVS